MTMFRHTDKNSHTNQPPAIIINILQSCFINCCSSLTLPVLLEYFKENSTYL